MKRYSQLDYVVPRTQRGKPIEVAFAITPDELVRRTVDLRPGRSGDPIYEVVDLISVTGEQNVQDRVPSAPRAGWVMVSGSDETPD